MPRKVIGGLIQAATPFTDPQSVPGPTTERIAGLGKKYGMVMVIPVYEREQYLWKLEQPAHYGDMAEMLP
jgi:hypothetical protein